MDNTKILLIIFSVFLVLIIILNFVQKPNYVVAEKQNSVLNENLLNLSETAYKYVTPNKANIVFTITTTNKDPKKSQEENANILAKIKTILKDYDIKIETLSYTINKKYDYNYKDYTQKIFRGYNTSHQLKIIDKNILEMGLLLDKIEQKNITINNIYFDLDDKTQEDIKNQLYVEALKKAKTKAENITKALNLTLKTPKSISINNFVNPYYSYKTELATMRDNKTNTVISPKEVKISITINVVFRYE